MLRGSTFPDSRIPPVGVDPLDAPAGASGGLERAVVGRIRRGLLAGPGLGRGPPPRGRRSRGGRRALFPAPGIRARARRTRPRRARPGAQRAQEHHLRSAHGPRARLRARRSRRARDRAATRPLRRGGRGLVRRSLSRLRRRRRAGPRHLPPRRDRWARILTPQGRPSPARGCFPLAAHRRAPHPAHLHQYQSVRRSARLGGRRAVRRFRGAVLAPHPRAMAAGEAVSGADGHHQEPARRLRPRHARVARSVQARPVLPGVLTAPARRFSVGQHMAVLHRSGLACGASRPRSPPMHEGTA